MTSVEAVTSQKVVWAYWKSLPPVCGA